MRTPSGVEALITVVKWGTVGNNSLSKIKHYTLSIICNRCLASREVPKD